MDRSAPSRCRRHLDPCGAALRFGGAPVHLPETVSRLRSRPDAAAHSAARKYFLELQKYLAKLKNVCSGTEKIRRFRPLKNILQIGSRFLRGILLHLAHRFAVLLRFGTQASTHLGRVRREENRANHENITDSRMGVLWHICVRSGRAVEPKGLLGKGCPLCGCYAPEGVWNRHC